MRNPESLEEVDWIKHIKPGIHSEESGEFKTALITFHSIKLCAIILKKNHLVRKSVT